MLWLHSNDGYLLLSSAAAQVRAYKRISIEHAPNVLTVHLKRFDFFGRGHKITKKVEFDMQLDLGPFMTSHLQRKHHHKHKHHHHHQHQHPQPQPQHHHHAAGTPGQQQHHPAGGSSSHQPVLYDLFAVLVHHGHSLHSGHYVCFVKAGNGMWYHCDDHRVAQVSERNVQGQQAYILFYVRRQPKGAAAAAAAAGAAAKSQAAAAAAALGHAAASAAAAAAAAANRQQQLRQGKQQQQDSTKTLAAAGQAGASTAVAAGQETGSGSQAKARKVVTSSTESTANASPAEDGGAAPR